MTNDERGASAVRSSEPWHTMNRLVHESRRTRAHLTQRPGSVPGALRRSPLEPGEGDHRLGRAAAGAWTSLDAALERRRATRLYAATPVDQAALAEMLRAATAGDRRDWSSEQDADLDLRFSVVAWRVSGLGPAVYHYVPAHHALRLAAEAPQAVQDREALFLQAEFAEAPFVVLISGNLAAACARHGGWGHRQLLVRAGMAGQRLWLTAAGLGLAGTVFAGFIGHAARGLVELDGYRHAGLLAFAAGHPLSPSRIGPPDHLPQAQAAPETE